MLRHHSNKKVAHANYYRFKNAFKTKASWNNVTDSQGSYESNL